MEDYSAWRLCTEGFSRRPEGIRYKRLSSSGSVSYEESTVTEDYLFRTQDLVDFCYYAFPDPVVVGFAVWYPRGMYLYNMPSLIARSLTFKSFIDGRPLDPFQADTGAEGRTYEEYVVVTVEYSTSAANDQEEDPNDPETFLEISMNASGTLLNSPQCGLAKWELGPNSTAATETGGSDPTTDPVKITGESTDVNEPDIPRTVISTEVEWSVRWPRVPYAFWNSILIGRLREKLGHVNSAVMPLFLYAPVDTVLFMSFQMTTNYTWRSGLPGQSPVTLDMKFIEKNFKDVEGTQITHQHIWRPDYGWRKLTFNGEHIYAQANLNQIWSPSS